MEQSVETVDTVCIKELVDEFTENLTNGNKAKCLETINRLIEKNISIETIYEGLFKESLYKVGELWEDNKISVAKEHLATAITENLMNHFYESLEYVEKNKYTFLSCTLANEQHQVGAKMITDIFEQQQWNSYFLGSETSIDELISKIEELKPNVISLSLSVFMNFNVLYETLEVISARFPDLKILVGGQAFLHGGVNKFEKFKNVQYLNDISELEEFIANFA